MILASTKDGISLGIKSICKILPNESSRGAEFRFKQRVGNAKIEDRLKVINENSTHKFEKINDNKFVGTDIFGNQRFLFIK